MTSRRPLQPQHQLDQLGLAQPFELIPLHTSTESERPTRRKGVGNYPTGAAAREALWLVLQLGGPLLLALLVIGLAVSVLQALTQVQEATLAFLPKLAALGLMLMLLGPSMAESLRGYAEALFDRAVAVGGLP